MDNYKTIIEIGSFSIKTIIYTKFNKDYQIVGTGKSKTHGYNGNDIENIDDFIDCIKTYGLVKGILKGSKRILSCHPLGGDGFDPVKKINLKK